MTTPGPIESVQPNLIHRREALRRSAAASLAASGLLALPGKLWAAHSKDAAAIVPGKDRRLIVYGDRPVEIETPIELLREHAITPKSIMFVRNNQMLDGTLSLNAADDDRWSVELGGLVEFPRSITVAQLRKMNQVEETIVLQCSGNGRALFSKLSPASGSQWQNGAMANVRFKGVPLREVVETLKVNVSPEARFLTAEGNDSPIKPEAADFEHSLPLDAALDRTFLALEMNGEPIPAVHGGPLRLITPGYYGTMNVKWLGRLRFEATETANHHQVRRYRTPRTPIEPGDKFKYGLDNADPNWDMRIKSAIFSPLDGQDLPVGKTKVDGVAWNDGQAEITSVEISTDGCRTWKQAKLEPGAGRYAWHPWQIVVDLPRGEQEIAARAIDALGRTQPIDGAIQWNPAGYAWSAVQRVRVRVG